MPHSLSFVEILALLNEFNTWKIKKKRKKKNANHKTLLCKSNTGWKVSTIVYVVLCVCVRLMPSHVKIVAVHIYIFEKETILTFNCIFLDAIRAKTRNITQFQVFLFLANYYTNILPPNPKCQFGCECVSHSFPICFCFFRLRVVPHKLIITQQNVSSYLHFICLNLTLIEKFKGLLCILIVQKNERAKESKEVIKHRTQYE